MKPGVPSYTIRRSPRAKHVRLSVTVAKGLQVVVPKGYDERRIPDLLERKRAWITKALKRVEAQRAILQSENLPETLELSALGEVWKVSYNKDAGIRRGIRVETKEGNIILSASSLSMEYVVTGLRAWMREKVRNALFPQVEELAKRHGFRLRGLLVKSQRTRWASCSTAGNITLNTSMLFLPPESVRYLIIHELCHTVHMNHSKQFWQLVAKYEPDYKALDAALDKHWLEMPPWVHYAA